MTLIYNVNKGSSEFKLIFGSHSDMTKPSKSDWMCNLCRDCTSNDCAIFEITRKTKSQLVCYNCLDPYKEVIDNSFGNGTSELCKKFMEKDQVHILYIYIFNSVFLRKNNL